MVGSQSTDMPGDADEMSEWKCQILRLPRYDPIPIRHLNAYATQFWC
jgi:hypothetical protein